MSVRVSRVIAAVAFLVGVLYVGYELLEAPEVQVFGPTVTAGPAGQRLVALTFDDGPNPPYTDRILGVLERNHVRATFFVVGRAAQAHPGLLRRMAADGDAIGNHTWDHPHLNWIPLAAAAQEIERTDAAVFAATGRHTWLLRPPFGARDWATMRLAHRLGYTVVMWSVPLPDDWDQPGVATIVRRLLARVHDGAIIVLHDGNRGMLCRPAAAAPCSRAQEVDATSRLIAVLRREGYRFVTVPQLIAADERARSVARRE